MPTVLVVEDDITLRTTLVDELEKLGVKADSAANGIEANRRVHSWRYELILMDIQMPEMDGLEATGAIRAYERRKGDKPTVIIGLSGSDNVTEQQAIECGMSAFHYKPLLIDDLKAIVEKWLPPEKRTHSV